MPNWIREDDLPTTLAEVDVTESPTAGELQEQLRAEQETTLLLQEDIADLELMLEDRGWRKLAHSVTDEFSAQGRRALAANCRMMAVANPLIKRALLVRIGYIWGQGVTVTAVDGKAEGEDGSGGQDVNAVVQDFWDANTATLTGSQAQEELERCLGTDGGVYLAAFTDPLAGVVRIRSTPTDEIVDILTNPEDRDEPWFYIREYVEQKLEAGYAPGTTRTRNQRTRVAHPALGYRPNQRIRTLSTGGQSGIPVRWDAPILHVPVNRLDGWKFGVPDVYAAIAWARMYRDFLVDWAQLTKSLAQFAWRKTSGTKGRAQAAATKIQANAATSSPTGLPPLNGQSTAGKAAVGTSDETLEAIPKSGATIDANSGKPLAGMVAAGVGLPVTMLLADPGITGARATAETLDLPTILEMGMRRLLWQGKLTELLNYVIDQAATAPRGQLRGTVRIDAWGRRVVTLAGDTERGLEWDWPPLVQTDPVQLIAAIVDADGTGKMPDEVTIRLLLAALGVKNVDEEIEKMRDEDGNIADPRASAGDDATRRFRQGEDPASELA
jgi:hypothetical protein